VQDRRPGTAHALRFARVNDLSTNDQTASHSGGGTRSHQACRDDEKRERFGSVVVDVDRLEHERDDDGRESEGLSELGARTH
jgi:hypothetical protein